MSEDTPVETGALAVSTGPPGLDDAPARRERLKQVFLEARGCSRCAQLAASRTNVVFGSGHADAALMLVGDVPTAREDEQGVPFTGAAGKLVDDLLGSIGMARDEVFITHALKCRPPGNRDADPSELMKCRSYLEEQLRLVRPRVVCTLGNLATRVVTGDSTPVTARHGRDEVVEFGGVAIYVVPLFHPAAALYTRTLLDTLRADVASLPELLARPTLPQPEQPDPEVLDSATPTGTDDAEERTGATAGGPLPGPSDPAQGAVEVEAPPSRPDEQLGLF